jgi:bifunctional UDP-N-acetylglucosamine pyrophosphorylase / glucosamine-1-phosphate N-acetyltransferase
MNSQDVTVVVLAAGLGTRMRSQKAKVLHEVGGDALINHVIRAALAVARPENIVVVVGFQADAVREIASVHGVRFAEQAVQRGTGDAIRCARAQAERDSGLFLILNGDGPLIQSATVKGLLDAAQGTGSGGAIVTTHLADPFGYGRIIRDAQGHVEQIVEQKAATREQLEIHEINAGLYCFEANNFWSHLDELEPNGQTDEVYLTDMIGILHRNALPILALAVPDESEVLGINTRVELAAADKVMRGRKATQLMLEGVTIESPETVTIDVGVQVGMDTVIEAGVQLRGATKAGSNCRIGAGAFLRDCTLSDDVTILPYVVADQTAFGTGCSAGPFARFRLGSEIQDNAHVGNFVELKKTRFGAGSKAGHLAYLGDAEIGENVNVGAGTITCNYDGRRKHATKIDDDVFVGSNSTLVAPLEIGRGAFIAAGSTITRDVEDDALAIGRAYQTDKPGWSKTRRESDE